jgi:hypothetical protein
MDKSSYTGTCLCGELRYEVCGRFKYLCNCYCRSCQRASGAPYVAWGTADLDDFRVQRGQLRMVASSPGVERGFCGNCGSCISYAHKSRAGDIDITLATLDQPDQVVPQAHIWLQDKLPWVAIGDELPRYQTRVTENDQAG